MNPYAIDGPLLVSFSGGRTSGLMLRRFLDLGNLRARLAESSALVAFANTGRERPETLDFVHACERQWEVSIAWVERAPGGQLRRVAYETASRNAEPFDALIEERGFLPHPRARFCTTELKVRAMKAAALALGWSEWTNAIGIRADEPRRVAKVRARQSGEVRSRERWEEAVPLADEGIDEPAVLAFWKAQPFDLKLNTWEGNCDLCFLKTQGKRVRVMQDRPGLAPWWIEKEQRFGRWRGDGPSYAQLRERARLPVLPAVCDADADLSDCACTD